MGTDGGADDGQMPRTFVRALRRDPAHAVELAVLYALPHLVPQVERWRRRRVESDQHSVEERGRRLVRRTVSLSRRDGAVTGTSFYFGMPAAVASTYVHQLLMVLEIAALHGRDPRDPVRAAELLVIQGRYRTVAAASEALSSVGSPRTKHPRRGLWSALVAALRQVPLIIGVKLRSARSGGVVSMALTVIQIVSYLVPVLSIPVCAATSARSTRRLGKAAQEYYRPSPSPTEPAAPLPTITFPPGRGPRARRLVNVTLAVSAFVAVAVGLVWVDVGHHRIRVALWLAEVAVVIAFGRLWWITRPERATA